MFEGWGVAAAAIGAVGAVGGAAISASAAGNAASAQENAANSANQTQLSMFNTTNSQQAPYRQAGGQALNALSGFYGLGGVDTSAVGGGSPAGAVSGTSGGATGSSGLPDYNSILSNLPGYQFQLQQGSQAVDQNLAAQGLLQSGAAGKELQQYGQGVASTYANQYVNGLQSLAGLGQSSTQASGQLGQQTANQIGSNQIYAGNAQASSYANQANAINGGLGNITGALGYMNSPYNSSTSTAIGNGYQNDIYNNSSQYIPAPTFEPLN